MKIFNELKAFFIILSTIIGLGVFVLPYTFANSGYYFFIWLFLILTIFLIFHLIWGEIIFQTKDKHNLPGLASIYIHPKLKHIVWFFDYFGMIGVFLIYFIALAKFWSLILPINSFVIKFLFALFNLYFLFKNLQIFSRFEMALSLGIIFIFLGISFNLLPYFEFQNIKNAFFNTQEKILPYGILLFSFSGVSALPLVYDLIGKNKKIYFKVNFYSLLGITCLYLIYIFSVVGVLGLKVSEESLQALSPYLSKLFLLLAVVLVTLNITFVDMAYYLKRGLIYDYKLSSKIANIILAFSIIPLIFLESQNLIKLISLISEIFIGFNFLITTLIYLKIKNKEYFKLPKFLIIIISIILFLGIIHGIF